MKTQFTFDPHFGQLRNRDGDSIASIPKREPETGRRIAATLNACHGLALPADVKPGILAELVAAARGTLDMAARDGIVHDLDALNRVLADLAAPEPVRVKKLPGSSTWQALDAAGNVLTESESRGTVNRYVADKLHMVPSATVEGEWVKPLQALADRTETGGPVYELPLAEPGAYLLVKGPATVVPIPGDGEGFAGLVAARDRVSEILEDPAGDGEDLRDAVATLLVALNGADNREPVSPPEPPVFQGDLEALRKHLPDPDNMGSSEYTAIHETIFDSFSPDDGDTPAEFARNVCREFIAGAQGILAKLEPVSPDEDDHLINWRAMHRDSGDVYCADGTLAKGTDKAAPTFTGMGHKEACEHAVSLFGVNATAYAESRNVPPVSPA